MALNKLVLQGLLLGVRSKTDTATISHVYRTVSGAAFRRKNFKSEREDQPNERSVAWAVLSGGFCLAAGAITYKRYKMVEGKKDLGNFGPGIVHAAEEETGIPGAVRPGLPTYTMEEVSKHVSRDKGGVWVTYKNGVYDITNYVRLHPGGSIILMAAGKSMEPFWDKYTVHNSDIIYEQLEYFRIGNISQISKDKGKRSSTVEPWMNPDSKDLDVNVGDMPITLSMENLKTKFSKKTVVATVKCSSDKSAEKKEMRWAGVTLGDILQAQGVNMDETKCKYVAFESLQTRPDGKPFTSLYPIDMVRSLKDEILVAYEMNDDPIPPQQGHPYRVIVKGHGGGKQVKWLRKIRLSTADEDAG